MPVDWRLWLPEAETLFFDGSTDAIPAQTGRRTAHQRGGLRACARPLTPSLTSRREKQTFVPDELQAIEPAVREICTQLNWELIDLTPSTTGLKWP